MWGTSRIPRALRTVACAALVLALACSGGGGGSDGIDVELAEAFAGLAFDRPVKLVQHPDDPDRWYVLEQGGAALTFLASDPLNTLTTALDLSATIDLGATTGQGEQGLLGLAFDPAFDALTGGELYLAYTDEDLGQSILARYESDDGGLTFTPLSVPLLAIDHPRNNHNAGDLHFDPAGEFLYYSMGDGGGAGDPDENAQDPRNLLGTILRLDVRGAPPPGLPYGIPPGNPNAGNPSCWDGPKALACPEIFAWGFRNPWRIGVDPANGELWTGDVGQSTLEEIDFVVAGRNYGWDCLEGTADFEFVPPCNTIPLEPPEVVHPRGEARSITGGVVYRGSDVPALFGFYVYGDFLTGNVWALDTGSDAPPVDLDVDPHPISAFAQDADGEVYLVTFGAPSIYRIVPAAP